MRLDGTHGAVGDEVAAVVLLVADEVMVVKMSVELMLLVAAVEVLVTRVVGRLDVGVELPDLQVKHFRL